MNIKFLLFTVLLLSFQVLSANQTPAKVSNKQDAENKLIKMFGGKRIDANTIQIGGIKINTKKKELSFPTTLNMWNNQIEVAICTDLGRMHESLLVTKVKPFNLQLALILIGAKNGSRRPDDPEYPPGTIMQIDIEPLYSKRQPIENLILNDSTQKQAKPINWYFVGSNFVNGKCKADEEGNLVNINSMDMNTIIDPPYTKKYVRGIFSAHQKHIDPIVDLYNEKENKDTLRMPITVYIYPKPKGQAK